MLGLGAQVNAHHRQKKSVPQDGTILSRCVKISRYISKMEQDIKQLHKIKVAGSDL